VPASFFKFTEKEQKKILSQVMSLSNKKNIGCVIFARYNSKRLPGKVLVKIGKKTLLDIVYDRAKKIFDIKNIVVATSTSPSDNKIYIHCKKKNYNYFRGDLNNVLFRAVSCLKRFGFSSIARICCDRPFFNYKELKLMINKFESKKYDIISNCYNNKIPAGLTNEIIDAQVLLKKSKIIMKKNHQEHMMNYFYQNSKLFNILTMKTKYSNYQLSKNYSIDDYNDLKNAEKIINKYGYFHIIKSLKN
jgi:spore coat polysaccharide biosynthesis protein SpsF